MDTITLQENEDRTVATVATGRTGCKWRYILKHFGRITHWTRAKQNLYCCLEKAFNFPWRKDINKNKRQNHRERLVPDEFPCRPWEVICTDLLDCSCSQNMTGTVSFSRHPAIAKLTSATPDSVIVQHVMALLSWGQFQQFLTIPLPVNWR